MELTGHIKMVQFALDCSAVDKLVATGGNDSNVLIHDLADAVTSLAEGSPIQVHKHPCCEFPMQSLLLIPDPGEPAEPGRHQGGAGAVDQDEGADATEASHRVAARAQGDGRGRELAPALAEPPCVGGRRPAHGALGHAHAGEEHTTI